MAVEVTTSAAFSAVSTTPLFSDSHLVASANDVPYDVSADGRFVLDPPPESCCFFPAPLRGCPF